MSTSRERTGLEPQDLTDWKADQKTDMGFVPGKKSSTDVALPSPPHQVSEQLEQIYAKRTLTGEIEIFGPNGRRIQTPRAARRGRVALNAPADMTGLNVTGAASGAVATVDGERMVELTFTGAGLANLWIPVPAGVYSRAELVFDLVDAAQWNGGYVQLNITTDNNFNVGVRAVRNIGAGNGWTGRQTMAPHGTTWTNLGAGSWSSTMTYALVKFQTAAGAPAGTKVRIKSLTLGAKYDKPRIIVGADDGHSTWYDRGIPLCEKYGIPSYLAYIHDSAVAGAPSMTVAQWQDAIARGHYGVVHGCKTGVSSLRDYMSGASPEANILADITYNRDGMLANELDPTGVGRHVYVYPQGNHQPSSGAGDMRVINALTTAGFEAGRLAAQNGGIAPGCNPMYLPILGHWWSSGDETGNITALVALMQAEIAAGRDAVLMFHEVRDTPSAAEHISPGNLETVLRAASVLVSDGAADWGRLTDYVA